MATRKIIILFVSGVVLLLGEAKSQGLGVEVNPPVSIFHTYENNTNTGADVGLTIEQDGTGDAASQFILTGGQRWVMGIDNSDGDKFKFASNLDLNTNARLTLQTNGNVGIGTTAPTELLHISSTVDAEINITADTDNSGEGDNAMITFRQDGGTTIGFLGLEGNAGTNYTNSLSNATVLGSTNDAFQIANGGTVHMTIENGGDVGMGTSTPDGDLTIESTGNTQLFMRGNGNDYSASIRLCEGFNYRGGFMQYDAAGNDLILGIHDADDTNTGTDVESMRISRANGFVGILVGNDANEALEVNGAILIGNATNTNNGTIRYTGADFEGRVGGAWQSLTGGGGGGGADFSNGGEAGGANRTLGNTDAFDLGFETNNATRMTIESAGNVGVGTTNPAQEFDVNGDIRLSANNADLEFDNANKRIRENGTDLEIQNFNDDIWIETDGGGDDINLNAEDQIRFYADGLEIVRFETGNDLQAIIRNDNSAQNDNGWVTAAIDYGEFFEKLNPEEEIGIFEVVGVKNGKITKDIDGASMIFVTSTDGGLRGGNPMYDTLQHEYSSRDEDPDWLVCALIGQVPVIVQGEVNEGDYIIPTGKGDGKAIAVPSNEITMEQFNRIIGKSLESTGGSLQFDGENSDFGEEWEIAVGNLNSKKNEGEHVVNVAVNANFGLPTGIINSLVEDNAMANKKILELEKNAQELDNLRAELEKLKSYIYQSAKK